LLAFIASALAAASHAEDKPAGASDMDWWFDIAQKRRSALAFPELAAKSDNARARAAEVSRTLIDDISFASVFEIVDPETYPLAGKTHPLDYHRWESIGADVVITGSVALAGDDIAVEIRIHDVLGKKTAFETQYLSKGSSRAVAHHIADSILQRFGLVGIARTQIAFASDRAGDNKSLFISGYDGYELRRATQNRHLDFQPRFSPDGSALSFISYPKKNAPAVLALLNGEPLFEGPGMIFSASWSPDGEHLAFASTRDEPGNAEIYLMRRDRSEIRRLTHHPGIDVSPTWSPTGRELAFTSDRTGSPQIYIIDAEGLNLRRVSMTGSYNAEPAWSPSTTFSEIAYATRIRGSVFDIVLHDLGNDEVRRLTSNHGLNEGPQWAPNGRHIVFSSTRTGTPQVFTMNRDGSNQRQITFDGQNSTPSWGPMPRN
jgi:TolB protein